MALLLHKGSLKISFICAIADAVGGFGFGWFIAATALVDANGGQRGRACAHVGSCVV